MKKRRQRRLPILPVPRWSGRLLVTLAPRQVGMFRFLLESYENLAAFTVLDRHEALLKVFYSPHQEQAVLRALAGIEKSVPLRLSPWPFEQCPEHRNCERVPCAKFPPPAACEGSPRSCAGSQAFPGEMSVEPPTERPGRQTDGQEA